MFGDTATSRAVVTRDNDGHKPGEKPLQLTTDNAAVGALRRGGVLGELAFLLGLGLLLWHAWRGPRSGASRRTPPAWLTVAAVGSVPTIATADWLLGGTGGTLWILLVAGEAWLVLRPAGAENSEPDPLPLARGTVSG
jgi:O-antigen ligase